MRCPHKDKEFPPCDVVQHPHNQDIYFCKICQESFDVRNIGNQSPSSQFVAIVGIILVILGITIMYEQPVPSTPSQVNPPTTRAN